MKKFPLILLLALLASVAACDDPPDPCDPTCPGGGPGAPGCGKGPCPDPCDPGCGDPNGPNCGDPPGDGQGCQNGPDNCGSGGQPLMRWRQSFQCDEGQECGGLRGFFKWRWKWNRRNCPDGGDDCDD
jgi:hypothetical protein